MMPRMTKVMLEFEVFTTVCAEIVLKILYFSFPSETSQTPCLFFSTAHLPPSRSQAFNQRGDETDHTSMSVSSLKLQKG